MSPHPPFDAAARKRHAVPRGYNRAPDRMRIVLGPARGMALVVSLIVLGVLSGLGLALLTIFASEPGTNANQRDAALALYAADAALELAVHELAALADWTPVLAGLVASGRVDGAPSGTRLLPGGDQVDLSSLSNGLTCGRPVACSEAERAAMTVERPWGPNNPRWRLFIHGPPGSLGLPGLEAHYLAVWVGDDATERDGDPTVDCGSGAPDEGRGMVRCHALAIGPRSARRAIEAVIVRRCGGADGTGPCAPGIRVQSWQIVSSAHP
jgi:type II secretory pathway pseudopilin PulG